VGIRAERTKGAAIGGTTGLGQADVASPAGGAVQLTRPPTLLRDGGSGAHGSIRFFGSVNGEPCRIRLNGKGGTPDQDKFIVVLSSNSMTGEQKTRLATPEEIAQLAPEIEAWRDRTPPQVYERLEAALVRALSPDSEEQD
jgi:hypothetical protein